MDNTKDYTEMMSYIISSCLEGLSDEKEKISPFIVKQEKGTEHGILYVVVTSSLGLCGGYNLNVVRYLNSLIKEGDEVMMIGTRGLSKYDRKDVPLDEENVSFLDGFSYAKVKNMRQALMDAYASHKYQEIKLVYTHFKNSLTFVPATEPILPITQFEENRDNKDKEKNKYPYPPIFVPDRLEVFNMLLPKYLDCLLYERLTEAMVCEEGARRNAMENATDNADDLHNQLNIVYNKARQAEITSQINEIMAGRLADSSEE
jgi:F-type H+-transporting ATPase subunit gamma